MAGRSSRRSQSESPTWRDGRRWEFGPAAQLKKWDFNIHTGILFLMVIFYACRFVSKVNFLAFLLIVHFMNAALPQMSIFNIERFTMHHIL